jgi:transcriptional regulator with XRE-family HTH domain
MGTPNRCLKKAREALHLTQAQLAEKVGASVRAVRSWEAGKIPSLYYQGKLCEALKKDSKDLCFIEAGEQGSAQHPPLLTFLFSRTALNFVGAVLVLGSIAIIAMFVFRSVLSSPDQTTLSQTLDTFCKAMIAGNTDVASAQFTARGLQDFNPVERKSYISCKYDQLKMLPDKSALGHLEVVTTEKVTYSIGVTLIWDGSSWKINRWSSRKSVPKTSTPLQSHFDHPSQSAVQLLHLYSSIEY